MMDRRDFIKAMTAAGALPAFLEEGWVDNMVVGDRYLLPIPVQPGKYMTGISWYCHYAGSGQLAFPPKQRVAMDQTLKVEVDVHSDPNPGLEYSIITLIRGGQKLLEHLTTGEVDMVYVMFETFTEDGQRRYFSQGGRVTDDDDEFHDSDLWDQGEQQVY